MANHWRRFLPGKKSHVVVLEDGNHLSTIRSLEQANEFIDRLKALPEPSGPAKIERIKTLLLAQTPRAALAQVQMDTHKHGYHNREKRLYELIDFNDTFVNLVLAMPHEQLKGFAERLKIEMAAFCGRLNTPMFSDEQYDAIVRGLSREIAVFRAARYQGFDAHMTSRTEDAFGIDMVITQPGTGKQLNIDCKTPPAFRHRMEELLQHGRISEAQLLEGDEQDFLTVVHHRNDESVPVTLMCIRPDTLGDIHDFSMDDAKKLTLLLNTIFATV